MQNVKDNLNRLRQLSSSLISDALTKLGLTNQVISGIEPLSSSPMCGIAFTALYVDKDDSSTKLYSCNRLMIDEIPRDQNMILIIENRGRKAAASTWGYLVSLYAQKRGIVGMITNGSSRDAEDIRGISYPVYCVGCNPRNSNEAYNVVATQSIIELYGVKISPYDYILADESGIVIIPNNEIIHVLSIAEQKNKQEHIIENLINEGFSFTEIDKRI